MTRKAEGLPARHFFSGAPEGLVIIGDARNAEDSFAGTGERRSHLRESSCTWETRRSETREGVT